MKRFSLLVSVVALSMGTASMLRTDHYNRIPSPENVAHITDAAFRDGLYLGKLAAGRGAEPHVAIGRWATLENRSSFAAGYQQGYSEVLSSRAAVTVRGLRTK